MADTEVRHLIDLRAGSLQLRLRLFDVGDAQSNGSATRSGATCRGLHGPEVDALYASGASWLAGEPLNR